MAHCSGDSLLQSGYVGNVTRQPHTGSAAWQLQADMKLHYISSRQHLQECLVMIGCSS